MTRLFAYTCNQPEHIHEALEPLRHVLVTRPPIARWGFGYVQSGEVLLAQTPRPSTAELAWLDRLIDVRSDYVIAHAAADDGLRGTENTQPFRYRQWLFAQESTREQPEDAMSAVREALVPAFLRRRIRGKTAAELVFHVLLAELHRGNHLDSHDLPAQAIRQVVSTAVAATRELGLRPGNLIVTNGRTLAAARLDQPLAIRRLTLPLFDRQAHGFNGVLLASDAPQTEPGFETVPADALILAHRDASVDILSLDPA